MENTAPLIIRQDGHAGRISLNRPDLLNALSHEMVLSIEDILRKWVYDNTIQCIVIDAIGEKAFCAGGDINSLYEQGRAQDFISGAQFWRDEYRLNALIADYPKQIFPIMNGIVMGGGVGLSAHASHRIVCETTMLALPECSIGLVPDVGSTHLLAQAPGFLGEYLALTGKRLSGHEAIYCGFADTFVPHFSLPEFIDDLGKRDNSLVVTSLTSPLVDTDLAANEEDISAVFGQPELIDIVNTLSTHEADWAQSALKSINRSSPLSCKVAFELVRKARANPGLHNALRNEFCFVSRAMEGGDFLEGVRAAIIDRDSAPKWLHSSIEDVSQELLKWFLRTPDIGDVVLLDSKDL